MSSVMPKQPAGPPAIADEVCIAALELVLKPLGTSLKDYSRWATARRAAIEAMRGVLTAERERAAGIIDAANNHYAEMHEAAKLTRNKAEARDIQTMRIATVGLSTLIRGEA